LYTVQVRACTPFNGKNYYSDWSEITCIEQTFPTKISVNKKKKQVTIKWKKTKGATGYEVWASTKKSKGFKKIKNLNKNKTSFTLKKVNGKKLNLKKNYYFYIKTKKGNNTSGVIYGWYTKQPYPSSHYYL